MIDSFRRIGEKILGDNPSKRDVLNALCIAPQEEIWINKEEKIEVHPLIFDFDLEKKIFEIKEGGEINLNSNTKGDYFLFKKISPNSCKISFNTNDYTYHLRYDKPTPLALNEYIRKNNFKVSKNFLYLIQKLSRFYDFKCKYKSSSGKLKDGFLLNPKYLKPLQREKFYKLLEEKRKKDNLPLGKELNHNNDEGFNIYKELIKLEFPKIRKEKLSFIHINGKPITKLEIFSDYENLMYKAYFKRFFEDKKKVIEQKKRCHICNTSSKVTNDVSLPTKFYNLHKRGFFENLNQNNAYKSFTLCEKCFSCILVGINYIEMNLNFNFQNINFYLIPKSESFFDDLDFNTQHIKDELDLIENEKVRFSQFRALLKEKKLRGFLFDMLFYKKDQSAFKILNHITDISIYKIREISKNLEDINTNYVKGFFNRLIKYHINLSSFRYALFSNRNYKIDNFSSYLLEIISSVYENIPIDRQLFLRQFLTNYKKNFYSKNQRPILKENCFETLFLMAFIDKMHLWKVNKMNIQTYAKIKDKNLIEFFELHSEIDDLRKGFVVLGYLINRIIAAQQKKRKNKIENKKQENDSFFLKRSSTFINKINFDGINELDLKELMSEIEEYYTIYDLNFQTSEKLFAYEILVNFFENPKIISSQELTFYILLGIHLGEYIAKIRIGEMKKKNDLFKEEGD